MVSALKFRYTCTMSRPFHWWPNTESMTWQRRVTWFSYFSTSVVAILNGIQSRNPCIISYSTMFVVEFPNSVGHRGNGLRELRESILQILSHPSKIAFPSGSPDFRCSTNQTYGFLIVRPTYVFPVLRSTVAQM